MYSTSMYIHIYIHTHTHARVIYKMEIFISLYAFRSLFTHLVLICVRFVSNFNSKSESHLVSFFRLFFSRWSGRGYTFTCMIRACHARYQWNKKFIQIPTQRQQKKSVTHTHSLHKENCVPVSYSFFSSFVYFICRCM